MHTSIYRSMVGSSKLEFPNEILTDKLNKINCSKLCINILFQTILLVRIDQMNLDFTSLVNSWLEISTALLGTQRKGPFWTGFCMVLFLFDFCVTITEVFLSFCEPTCSVRNQQRELFPHWQLFVVTVPESLP